ncbi:uncharacterized protein LOC130635447 [Hydractinia symbiolongicarpus]|uniref:uncharacterized protein LOC130635447 n=1 Tax=Hydractinia symbiolongicarpus TaxID=13093 RepID=UPI002550C186|nr:uncharacterized protein LOC130635447 [Hydractinia symbiolongicarpus]
MFFQDPASASERISVVMADKDIKEREQIQNVFPNVIVLICLFHTLRNFSREVTMEKIEISSSQRPAILNNLQKLAYSRTESEYIRIMGESLHRFDFEAFDDIKNHYRNQFHQVNYICAVCSGNSCGVITVECLMCFRFHHLLCLNSPKDDKSNAWSCKVCSYVNNSKHKFITFYNYVNFLRKAPIKMLYYALQFFPIVHPRLI